MKKHFCVFCKKQLKYKSHEGWMSHIAGEKHVSNRREFYLQEVQRHPEIMERAQKHVHAFHNVLANEDLPRGALQELLRFRFPEEPDVLGFQRYVSRLLRHR